MNDDTTITMEVTHQGRKGSFQMVFNEWADDQMPISFQDGLYRNEGTIYLNGKSVWTAYPIRELF